MSERLFCSWEVENCGFLSLLAVSQLQGNLLQVLVHAAEKSVLVMAEVPSGSDAGLHGTPDNEALVSLLFAAPNFNYFKTLVLNVNFVVL